MRSLCLHEGVDRYCRVTGKRHYAAELPQGDLESPYILMRSGKAEEVNKLFGIIANFTF